MKIRRPLPVRAKANCGMPNSVPPTTTLERVAREADTATAVDLLERTGHLDPVTSRLLLSAADGLEGNGALDTLFRHQLIDLLATRLLAAHTASPTTFEPTMGGL